MNNLNIGLISVVTGLLMQLPQTLYAQSAPSTPDTEPMNALSVPSKSLTKARMHPASLPTDTEFLCDFARNCYLGLTRGFGVSSNLFGIIGYPTLGPIVEPGSWLYLDGAVTYQFLRDVDNSFFAAGSLGYKMVKFTDSNDRVSTRRGLKFDVSVAQDITPSFTIGLVFDGWSVNHKLPAGLLENDVKGIEARDSLKKFYALAKCDPVAHFRLPVDIELINWKASHIDLPNHIRGYAHVEPFYIQNEVSSSELKWVERNFGMRVLATGFYESSDSQAGRFAVHAGAGVEATSSTWSLQSDVNPNGLNLDLPRRKNISPFLSLKASYLY